MGEAIKTRRGTSKGVITTYLYNNGDSCASVSGGWTGGRAYSNWANTGSGALEATRMRITGAGTGSYGYQSINLIDLTPYSKMIVDFQNGDANFHIGIYPTTMPVSFATFSLDYSTSTAARQSIELDISALTSGYIICGNVFTVASYVYSIKLEA